MAGAQPDRRKAARPDDPEHRGRRANPRAHAVLPATVVALSGLHHISLLDISRDGACLAGVGLPSVGKDVVLRCGAIDTFGTVVWAVADRCGLLFDEPISAKELVALRQVAVAAELSGMTHEERQATTDWMNGLAR
jgi:hypothetical protein